LRIRISSIYLIVFLSINIFAQDYKENFKNAKDDDEKISILEEIKKSGDAKQYAIVNVADTLNVRGEANDRSPVIASLKGNAVAEILKRETKKYTVKNAKGEEMENFWYNIKTEDGKKGFVFGEFIQVIESY
jgi:uncharacterized protein YgiM (DUF1202 family)